MRCKPCLTLILLFLAATASTPGRAGTQGEPGWQAAKTAVDAWYKQELPGSKIEKIVPAEEREILDHGLKVRYYGRVEVERVNKQRSRDHVAVTFTMVAGNWAMERLSIMGSDPIPDVEPPSDADAQHLFREAWKKDKCEGYEISEVNFVDEPTYQQELVSGDRSKARRWFIYNLEIHATGNGDFNLSEDGAAYVLEIKNGLLWDPAGKSWSVDPRWVKCSGFEKVKKD